MKYANGIDEAMVDDFVIYVGPHQVPFLSTTGQTCLFHLNEKATVIDIFPGAYGYLGIRMPDGSKFYGMDPISFELDPSATQPHRVKQAPSQSPQILAPSGTAAPVYPFSPSPSAVPAPGILIYNRSTGLDSGVIRIDRESATATTKSNGICVCTTLMLMRSGCECGSVKKYKPPGLA